MKYTDYFPFEDSVNTADTVDAFIDDAMRRDVDLKQMPQTWSEVSRITLSNELLTCYEFLKGKGLLKEYHQYREGE